MPSAKPPLLVAVFGPTGSGKTALALALAEKFHGEIVNCDSVALYREFEIGTAKPTAEERARAPHHLFDVLAPTEPCTAGDYARRARAIIGSIQSRRHLPIVAGGTGLYLRALLDGLFQGPPRSEEVRARLREIAGTKTAGHLHKILTRLDRSTAEKIHANDAPKLIRAIEVCLSSRQKMSALWQRGRDPLTGFTILRLGLNPDRDALYARLNQRAEKMFAAGLIEETRALHEKYCGRAIPLAAPGFKQALQFLRGELSSGQALAAAQQAHRNYAKRQLTWFRREPDAHWLNGFGNDQNTQSEAIATVEETSSQ